MRSYIEKENFLIDLKNESYRKYADNDDLNEKAQDAIDLLFDLINAPESLDEDEKRTRSANRALGLSVL